ncbi:MAG TPA: TlpA disulfide reductase family protein [Gammaproteobacteria bacterium]|nr:TlpA disulfide reductase family protein [Gammaproteobacteria bacterium]
MPIKRQAVLIFCALAVISVTAWLWFSKPGLQAAPAISFNAIDGHQISLRQFTGKPVLVNFWATSCPGCVKEMPALAALHQELAARGFIIIGVAMAYDPPDQVLRMVKEKQIPYTIALDTSGEIARDFDNVMLTPTSFLIAPDGHVAKHVVGELDIDSVRRQVQTWLGS